MLCVKKYSKKKPTAHQYVHCSLNEYLNHRGVKLVTLTIKATLHIEDETNQFSLTPLHSQELFSHPGYSLICGLSKSPLLVFAPGSVLKKNGLNYLKRNECFRNLFKNDYFS